jgi:Na+-driven multidrug efflux pump
MVAGVGLGNMYLNGVAMATVIGLNNGVATFVSQCNGQGNLKLCGVYLNRGRMIVAIAFIPISLVLSYAKEVFLIMDFDE